MFTLPPDPYKALGIPKDAQNPEIKAAYRKLVLKCHPDKVQDPQLKAEKQAEFQLVHQAYELLIDDISRDKYDEKVRYNEKYGELEREREKSKMSSSAPTSGRTPRTPSRSRGYYEPEIRTAEPRPSTFAKTGTPPSSRKFYETGHTSSHSWEDDLGSSSRAYDETRRFKKSASYEREREREWEREREYEKEREKEREREKQERRKRREKEAEELARESAREREREREQRDRAKQEQKAAKEAEEAKEAKKKKERRDKDKDKKKADKERKRDTEDKHRRKSPYVEPYHEDSDVEDATAHVFEKKSSSRKPEDEDTHPTMTTDRERKNSANLEFAARYLERSGAKPATLSRSPTFQDGPSYSVRHVTPIAAPTPPPATASAHPPPPPPPVRDTRDIDVEEDTPRRSSGRSGRTKPPDALRSSTKESREKSSHRKSGTRSASRDAAARPTVVEVTPGVTHIPALQKSYSDPHRVAKLNRSYTENYSPRPGPRPVPGMERQNTWQQGDDRGRGRARHVHAHSEESEDDVLHHPSWRTQSPEPMVGATTHRYAVDNNGKTRRKVAAEAMPIPSRGHKVRHVAANTSSPRVEPGAAGYHAEDYGDAPVHAAFSSVKYAPVVREEEVSYSPLPRYSSSYTKDQYSTPVY